MTGPPPETETGVWKPPLRYGYQETLRGLGGVVAPLLAGFSLAATATLVTADEKPPLAEWSIACWALAVALLLFSMQVSFLALARNPSPAEILNWRPEIAVDPDALEAARAQQMAMFKNMTRMWKLAGPSYDLGVVAFLAGVTLLLFPDDGSSGLIVAFLVACLGLAGEIWWTSANLVKGVSHPVIRQETEPDSVKPAPLGPVELAAVMDPERRRGAGLEPMPRDASPSTPQDASPSTPPSKGEASARRAGARAAPRAARPPRRRRTRET